MRKFLTGLAICSLLLSGVNFATASNLPMIESKTTENYQDELKEFIVGVKAGSSDIKEEVLKLGGEIVKEYEFINTLVVKVEPSKANHIRQLQAVAFVNEDLKVTESATKGDKATNVPDPKLIQNAYNSAVAADKVWSKGYTGTGVTVAVVDSGVLNEKDFYGRIVAEYKTSDNALNMADFFGHGTHVAGIIGGDGAASNGKYVGVAPGVNLINVKISDDQGMSTEQDLVEGLEWIYNNRDKHNIRVVNISSQIGAKQSYKESATAAVEILWNAGIVVVVSAGNNGGTECSVCYAPANDPFVITVGAVDDNGTKDLEDDSLKSWSSSGVTMDGHTKPELVAPGSEIISFMPKGNIRNIKPGNIVDKSYFKMGGTSMSAPVVSGVVALMLQVNPTLTPDQVKWVLEETTRNYGTKPNSAGIVSADAAAFFNVSNIPTDVKQIYELSPVLGEARDEAGNITWSNLSWSNLSWSNLSWSNAFDY